MWSLTDPEFNLKYFGNPVYTYSLKQGIEDGFLAPYKVIRIATDVDAVGYTPEKGKIDKLGQQVEQRQYNTKDFDRNLVLEKRTKLVASNKVWEYLRTTDPMAKTIVFCDDQDHAERMRQELVKLIPAAASNRRYVMRITGDDNEGKAQRSYFIGNDEPYPVIATTSKLLTTGVDAKTCKLIVLDQNINSMSEFKQIIGRGTRLREDYQKLYFTIMDFKGATRLIADPNFDGEPVVVYEPKPDEPVVPPDDLEPPVLGEPDSPPYGPNQPGDEGANTGGGDKRAKYVIDDVDVRVAFERSQYLRGAGNAGEFYTPRAITQFMVAQVNPNLAERETVLDPACGTGGFLTAAIDHFRHQIGSKSSPEDQRAIEALIHGIEKKQLPHLLCTTNMLLHGIDVPSQIEHRNTLGRPWNEWGAHEKVDCLITNPPFGGFEDNTVGGDYPPDLRTRETADMFMALIIKKLLKENGRAAVVLPDGFLFGEGIKNILKKLLLRDCKLHTIVRLPKGVFAPYTTIKTNLLFFTRGQVADDGLDHFHTDTIWFYEHPYPAGYKSYSKTKPIRLEEFKAEQDWWGTEVSDFADRAENEFAWKVDFKTKREQAEAAAQPHWDRAQALRNQVADVRRQAKYLSDSLVSRRKDGSLADALREQLNDLQTDFESASENDRPYTQTLIEALDSALTHSTPDEIISSIENACKQFRARAEQIDLQARDAQAAGDRLYWPIYNLDLKNPNDPEEESHDPDVLLEKYKKLLGEIEETQNQLKSELAAALAHHFSPEGVE